MHMVALVRTKVQRRLLKNRGQSSKTFKDKNYSKTVQRCKQTLRPLDKGKKGSI